MQYKNIGNIGTAYYYSFSGQIYRLKKEGNKQKIVHLHITYIWVTGSFSPQISDII